MNSDEDEWGELNGEEGWGDVEYNEETETIKEEEKNDGTNRSYKVYSRNDILSKQIPKLVADTKDKLFIEDEDMVIAILKHFKWNTYKVEEQYLLGD